MSNNNSIIVKKVKKVSGGGHHGGGWKVAYADFVTAMMAFFLLLWLLSMVSDEKRARLSAYFKYFSLYDSGGTSWMGKSSDIFAESGENKMKVFADRHGDTVENSEVLQKKMLEVGDAIKEGISKKMGDMEDQVLIDIVDEGIRIQMIDKEGSLMFERGKNTLTPKAREVLKILSKDINSVDNKIIIEGHTDSLPYAGKEYSNWELSTERASSARRALESEGLDPKRISRVAGYADSDPLIKDDPRDPRNRRISITLKAPERKKEDIVVIKSDGQQLKDVPKELISTIDSKSIPHPEAIMKEKAAAGTSTRDYDSIIRQGNVKMKNGNYSSNTKNHSPAGQELNNVRGGPRVPVIKELLSPVLSDDLFTDTPGGK